MRKIKWDEDACPAHVIKDDIPGPGCEECVCVKSVVKGSTMCRWKPSTERQENIICPYCGHIEGSPFVCSPFDNRVVDVECDGCKDTFSMTIRRVVTFTTRAYTPYELQKRKCEKQKARYWDNENGNDAYMCVYGETYCKESICIKIETEA